MHTQRANVHKAGEGNGPEVPGVDDVATIELGEGPVLGTRVSECSIERTDQKTIS